MNNQLHSEARTLRSETSDAMSLVEKRAIACRLLKWIVSFLGLPNGWLGETLGAIIISLFLILVSWISNRIVGVSLTAGEAIALAAISVLAGGSFLIVKRLHEITLPPNKERVLHMISNVKGLSSIKHWFESTFRLSRQILGSLLTSLAAVITLSCLSFFSSYINISLGLFIAVFGSMFAVGNGLYCAIVIPTISRCIADCTLDLYPYNPATTIGMSATVSVFSKLTLANGFVSTYVIILLFTASPWTNTQTIAVTIVWMLLGWGVTTYSFVYPNYYLSKPVARVRLQTLEILDNLIIQHHSNVQRNVITGNDALTQLIDLRDRVNKSRTSTINFLGIKDYFSSLLLPLLTFLIGLYQLQ